MCCQSPECACVWILTCVCALDVDVAVCAGVCWSVLGSGWVVGTVDVAEEGGGRDCWRRDDAAVSEEARP